MKARAVCIGGPRLLGQPEPGLTIHFDGHEYRSTAAGLRRGCAVESMPDGSSRPVTERTDPELFAILRRAAVRHTGYRGPEA
jgi:hypothetical protein